jgi:cyclopropane fatty-acyl-phospholipid synthase-like methyltransferase
MELNMQNELPDHLGGQNGRSWTDDGSLNIMWNLGCRKMLDVGCGFGGQVKLAESLGWESYGVDGDWTVLPKESNFHLNDYTKGSPTLTYEVDLIWCVEFLEHVEEKYMDNYMSTFQDSKAKYLIVTHAVPGQAGHHHVNCQEEDYWLDAFKRYGFEYDETLTKQIREESTMKKPFVARTGLVFKRS